MIQDQLVEYISSQMKAGTSRDVIKSTLVTAGWQAADVEDTLKKVESSMPSQPITASPAASPSVGATGTSASMSGSPFSGSSSTIGGAAKPGPQTIQMNDLISTTDPAMVSSTTSSAAKSFFAGSKPAEVKPVTVSSSAKQFPEKGASHGSMIVEIILGILVVVIGGLAGFLYFKNSSLNSQLATLNSTSGTASSQVATMQQSFNASTTAWMGQITTLNGENTELQTELSFYAVPAGASSTTTSTATFTGVVSGGGKVPYVITAKYGAKISVVNSKDANVMTSLQTFEASSTPAQFTGTYVLGFDAITLTGVNGTSL